MSHPANDQLVRALASTPGHARRAASQVQHLKPSRRQALLLVELSKSMRGREFMSTLKPGDIIGQARQAQHRHPDPSTAKRIAWPLERWATNEKRAKAGR